MRRDDLLWHLLSPRVALGMGAAAVAFVAWQIRRAVA